MTDDTSKLIEEIKQLKRRIKELEEQIIIDEFTGMYNQTETPKRLAVELSRARREGKSVSVVFLDIDNFGRFNKLYGQSAGDKVKKAVAKKIREVLRSYDIAGIVGGEEFVIILPNTDLKTGYLVAERIRKEIENLDVKIDGKNRSVTVSLGVGNSETIPLSRRENPNYANLTDEEILIDLANKAEISAKGSGKNQTRINLCGAPIDIDRLEEIEQDENFMSIIRKGRRGLVAIKKGKEEVGFPILINAVKRIESGDKQGDLQIEGLGDAGVAYTAFVTGPYSGTGTTAARNIVHDTSMQIVSELKANGITAIPKPEEQLWMTGPGEINFLNLLITHGCNLNCVYCTQKHKVEKKDEALTEEDWKRAISEVGKQGARRVLL